jgi:hypothetical protein
VERAKKAAELAAWVNGNPNRYLHWLEQSLQQMLEELCAGAFDEQIAALRERQKPRPTGTGSWIARDMQPNLSLA